MFRSDVAEGFHSPVGTLSSQSIAGSAAGGSGKASGGGGAAGKDVANLGALRYVANP